MNLERQIIAPNSTRRYFAIVVRGQVVIRWGSGVAVFPGASVLSSRQPIVRSRRLLQNEEASEVTSFTEQKTSHLPN